MDALLSNPRGFCAGVVRAIDTVERALEVHGQPVYVLHEIVHNHHVIEGLIARGAVFVESLDKIPDGSVVVFSAHGVPRERTREAKARNLRIIDATCPLVAKVHLEARRADREGKALIILGHLGHAEIDGHLGQTEGLTHVVSTVAEIESLEVPDPSRVAYVTQTTLSVDDTRDLLAALQRRFPGIEGPELNDICYATQNRQSAVRELAKDADLLLVVGARNSSNTNRLREVGEQCGLPSYLIQSAEELDPTWLEGKTKIAISAGASAPEHLVQELVERLAQLGIDQVHEQPGDEEDQFFTLPEIGPPERAEEPRPHRDLP